MKINWILPWRRFNPVVSVNTPELEHQIILEQLGRSIKSRRESLGLTIRELAVETRITTPVLESLERAWVSRLPERAYLYSILKQVEQKLSFPVGTLDPYLPQVSDEKTASRRKVARFTLGSIDVFTTWQGSLLYVVCISTSLLLLNRYFYENPQVHQSPMGPVSLSIQSREPSDSNRSNKPSSQLGLSPLNQGLAKLQPSAGSIDEPSLGILAFDLSNRRQLQVIVEGNQLLSLPLARGPHSLEVAFPMDFRFEPAINDATLFYWNGQLIQPSFDESGVLTVRSGSFEEPTESRPQTPPRSP